MTKSRETEAQKARRNLTNLSEDITKVINVKANMQKSEPKKRAENAFRVRDKALETKEVPEATELKSEEKQSDTTCPVFCNNPN